jgi:transcriptional regulator with XRE-family HTH domain
MDDPDQPFPHGSSSKQAQLTELLDREMKKRSWSQAELARQAELPRYTVSRVVRGETAVSAAVARKLAHALDLDEQLFNRRATVERGSLPEGVHAALLADGRYRLQVNAIVEPGVNLAVEVLVGYDSPIKFDKLRALLNALAD